MQELSISPAGPVALRPLPSLGNWHGSSQDLRKGLFVQELDDGDEALAQAWASALTVDLLLGETAH